MNTPPPHCPNDTDNDGNCALCHRLDSGCFLADCAAPCTPADLPPPPALCPQLDTPFAALPMCQ